jgi:predicted AlkP superfamily phosphohydrolase/phosphomutase
MKRKALSDKVLVLGVDGMDPALTRKYLDEGKLPNIKKFLERGVARKDLVMLGAMPTITPPLWTTLATGAYPETHGITCFFKQSPDDLDTLLYNFDSRNCKAEALWNVTVSEGKKTLVWHWPGNSWPPTSDDPNLHVVDGTSPSMINVSVAMKDSEKIAFASTKIESVLYKPKAANSTGAGCIITGLEVENKSGALAVHGNEGGHRHIILTRDEDGDTAVEKMSFDLVNSPIKEPSGWSNVPAGAKEFAIVTSKGLARRPALILKNSEGIYDSVAIYNSKKEGSPYVVIKNDGQFSPIVLEEIVTDTGTVICTRTYKLIDIAPDGSELRIWLSVALEADNDSLWQPKRLYKDVVDNVGHVPAMNSAGGGDPFVVRTLKEPSFDRYSKWQAEAMLHLIKKEGYDVVFSHLHNIDSHGHSYWHLCKNREAKGNDEKVYQQFMEHVYVDTDRYVGRFMHLLDEGWSIIITSDHGLITRNGEETAMLADPNGVMVPIMEQLGYTVVKKDKDGNRLHDIDWEKTKAVNPRGNFIWINLKGRNKTGSVDPEDKPELERKIIDDLYSYREPRTGRRLVSLAVTNKDAALFGLSGPETGDIIFFIEEDFVKVHGDSLSTHGGHANTSVSPIFLAAGKGLKKGAYVDRVIREVDVTPTLAILAGVRMPAQCEGAPLYQVFDEDV